MLLHFFAFLSLLSTVSSKPYECSQKNRYITVNSSWLLPLTQLASNQNCALNFIIPSGYFSLVEIVAAGVARGRGWDDPDEDIRIFDNSNYAITNQGPLLNSSLAWPGNFQISFLTLANTKMTLQINITVEKANVNNVVSTFETGPNLPSVVLYFEEWSEGTSVAINSQGSRIDFFTAFSSQNNGNDYDLNNIFIYSNGGVVGTLRMAVYSTDEAFFTPFNNTILYMAKRTDIVGVVLATDHSNIASLGGYYVNFVPVEMYDLTATVYFHGGTSGLPEAFTVVGDPIDVRGIYSQGDHPVSYLQSGPLQNFSSSVSLSQRQLPRHLAGNVHTFYSFDPSTSIKYTISE